MLVLALGGGCDGAVPAACTVSTVGVVPATPWAPTAGTTGCRDRRGAVRGCRDAGEVREVDAVFKGDVDMFVEGKTAQT